MVVLPYRQIGSGLILAAFDETLLQGTGVRPTRTYAFISTKALRFNNASFLDSRPVTLVNEDSSPPSV